MKNLPTELLRSFVTVAEVKGFTQAGELIGRSQPAISLQIKRLEKLIDHSLFSRKGQQLQLTQAGVQLLAYAQQILALNDDAIEQFSKTSVSGKIRLGIPSEFATTLLPKILGRFSKAYPNVTLEVASALSKTLLSNQNHYDLILALHDNPASVRKKLVKKDQLVWVASPDYKIPAETQIPLVAAPDGCIYRKRGIEKLTASKLGWRIVYTIPDLTGIETAIAAGLGITVLAKSTVPETLRILKPSDKLPKLGVIGISLIQKKGSNEAVQRLTDFVKTSLS